MGILPNSDFVRSSFHFQVTNAPLVPPLILFLAKHPLVSKYDLSSIREIGCGAAPLAKELGEALHRRLPHVECIRQGLLNL